MIQIHLVYKASEVLHKLSIEGQIRLTELLWKGGY